MGIYSTRDISREDAERMVEECRTKKDRSVKALSDKELDRELHEYVYSEDFQDIVGFAYNYHIKQN